MSDGDFNETEYLRYLRERRIRIWVRVAVAVVFIALVAAAAAFVGDLDGVG